MTEIMVHSSVGESFSFAKPELEKIQPKKEPDMSIDEDIEDESTLSFNSKLDNTCDKSSESTICGSNSDDSVVSDLQITKTSTNMVASVQDSANSPIKSDTSCEDYEFMTTSTVINTTYNMISKSGVHSMEKESTDRHHTSSRIVKNDSVDKSRVIVQILSDTKGSTKSQGLFQNKCVNENLSTHSFRDDVFKMLSKPQSSFDYKSDTKKHKKSKDSMNKCDTVQAFSKIERSMKIVKTRRKRRFNYFFARGTKLCEIKHVTMCLKVATIQALRALHYVIFDKYGICRSETQIAKTRRNISRFSGYPFSSNSEAYQKRLNCLLKLPRPMLREVHEAIFGKTEFLLHRTDMVNNLMTFFLDTETYDDIIKQMKPKLQFISEDEYTNLKERAKSGPSPVVLLKRLSCEDLNSMGKEIKMEEETEPNMQIRNETETKTDKTGDHLSEEPYALPAYILKGSGKELKHFPAIKRNVEKAKEKEINHLHHLLYGRIEPLSESRRNILEFSGFLECQNEFITKVHDVLERMDHTDMFELIKILCVRAKTSSRSVRIQKIMDYLKAPYNPFTVKPFNKKQRRTKLVTKQTKYRRPVHPVELWEEPENAESIDGGYRLRDFRRICSNIECSAPSDLTELSDLLFLKPSDETEIHDMILNFTRFGFTETSIHYHYRKTLLFYMGPCIVQKIAKLLDVDNWQVISSHEDLSACVLKFLMEKKSPDSLCVRPSLSVPKPSADSSSINKTGSTENNIPLEDSQQKTNQEITHCQESVFISSVSKSSVNTPLSPSDHVYLNPDFENRNDSFISNSSYVEDDSVPLRDFIHHPTDQELKQAIEIVVNNGLFDITLGDVVKRVYQLYPCFNLTYRENFIKSETRQMLTKMRQNAVETMKQNFSS